METAKPQQAPESRTLSQDQQLFNVLRSYGIMHRLESVHDYERLKKFRNFANFCRQRGFDAGVVEGRKQAACDEEPAGN